MKRIFILVAVATMSVLWGCTSTNASSGECEQSDSEVIDSAEVSLTPEEWEILSIIY